VQQPGSVMAGSNLAPTMVVNIKDQNGVLDTAFNLQVSLSIATGPAGALLAGTTTVTAHNGVATFSNLKITRAGNYMLTASIGGGILTHTSQITINPAPAAKSVVTATAAASWQFEPFASSVVINLTDQFGNPITAGSPTMTVAISSGPVGAVLTGMRTVPVIAGHATFRNLSLSLPGIYHLVFTSNTGESVISPVEIVSIPARRYTLNGAAISQQTLLFQQFRNAPIFINQGPPSIVSPSAIAGTFGFDAAAPFFAIAASSQASGINSFGQSLFSSLFVSNPDLLEQLLNLE
jgi:hypothetical protein